eukprot:6258164-Alexandrium_andersonii.AAC.1
MMRCCPSAVVHVAELEPSSLRRRPRQDAHLLRARALRALSVLLARLAALRSLPSAANRPR